MKIKLSQYPTEQSLLQVLSVLYYMLFTVYPEEIEKEIQSTKEKEKEKEKEEEEIEMNEEDEEEIWYYVDDASEEKGPFSTKNMQQWWLAGYLKPSLLVKRKEDEDFVPLITCANLTPTRTDRAAEASSTSSASSQVAQQQPISKAPSTPANPQQLQVHPSPLTRTMYPQQVTPTPTHAQPKPVQDSAEDWYYIDGKGDEHGPYSRDKMLQWYAAGYFKPQTRVRRENEPHPSLIYLRKDLFYDHVSVRPAPQPVGGFQEYAVSGAFQPFNNKFAGTTSESYWSAKGLESDPAGRQMQNFLDVRTLERTHAQSVAKRKHVDKLAKEWYQKNKQAVKKHRSGPKTYEIQEIHRVSEIIRREKLPKLKPHAWDANYPL